MTLFSQNPVKALLLEVIDFLRYKVETDQCTAEELRKFTDIATEQLDTLASTQEIADFYGQKGRISRLLAVPYGLCLKSGP